MAVTQMMCLWFLGPWQAQLDYQWLPPLPTRHSRALLARLTLAHPRSVPRYTLLNDLFPNLPPDSAAGRLRTTLYYLRQALGTMIVSNDDGLSLVGTVNLWHDLGQFLSLTTPSATKSELEQALGLVRGTFLDTPSDGWATTEARRLHSRYLDTLRRLVNLAQAVNKPAGALEAARRWAVAEPWEEAAHIAYLRALIDAEDRTGAEINLAKARSLLRQECQVALDTGLDILSRAIGRMPQRAEVAHRTAGSPTTNPSAPHLEFDNLPVIGREAELDQLETAWALARQGQPQIVTIEGVAGVGKSRLVGEIMARARLQSHSLVLESVAHEETSQQPLGLLRQSFVNLPAASLAQLRLACARLDDFTWSVLHLHLPEVTAVLPGRTPRQLHWLDSKAEAERRLLALITLFAAISATAHLLLVLEDVHQSDTETLDVMTELCQGERPFLTILVRRPLANANGDTDRQVLRLGPLKEQYTRHLLQTILGTAVSGDLLDRLWQRSGGNPLFIREILRTLVSRKGLSWQEGVGWQLTHPEIQLPDPVTELLSQRLTSLSRPARHMAETLAVLGRPAEEPLLAALWPDNETRLAAQADLLEQAILREYDSGLQFVHPWLREQILAKLSAETERACHRSLAAVLPSAADVSRMIHLAGAHDWPGALDCALAVATTHLERGELAATGTALTVAGQALQNLPFTDNETRWRWLSLQESYGELTGHALKWQKALAQMTELAQSSQRLDWQVVARLRNGRAQRAQGQFHQAEDSLRLAAQQAAQAGLPQLETQARATLASMLDDRGDLEKALAEIRLAQQAVKTVDDDALRLQVTAALTYLQMRLGQVKEAAGEVTAVLAELDATQQPVWAARLMRHLGILKIVMRVYGEGLHWLRSSVQQAQSTGDLRVILLCQTSLMYELSRLGLYTESQELGEMTLALARQMKARMQICSLLNALANAYYYTGKSAQALLLAQESVLIAESLGLPEYTASGSSLVAAIALELGRLSLARAEISKAERLLADIPHPTVMFAHTAARVWLAAGDETRAVQAARLAVNSVVDEGLTAAEAIEVLWAAGEVLAQVEGPTSARPILMQAQERLWQDLDKISQPGWRQAYLHAKPAHCQLASWPGNGARRLVWLPTPDAPTGRPLYPDELVPVIWTLHAPDDPPLTLPEGRRTRLLRLCQEALAQGGSATVAALAEIVASSPRTILRDIKSLRQAGEAVVTRGSS